LSVPRIGHITPGHDDRAGKTLVSDSYNDGKTRNRSKAVGNISAAKVAAKQLTNAPIAAESERFVF